MAQQQGDVVRFIEKEEKRMREIDFGGRIMEKRAQEDLSVWGSLV